MVRLAPLALVFLLLAACAEPEPALDTGAAAAQRLYPVQQDGRWGYIDTTGAVVVEPRYERAWSFVEGRALVQDAEGFGYLTPDGEEAIAPQYEDAWHFSDGLAPVQTGGQWGFVDTTGTVVIDPQFEMAPAAVAPPRYESGGPQPVRQNGQIGFAADGDTLVAPRFQQAWYFVDGLARVREGDQWGYLGRDGELAIPAQYDLAWDFHGPLALVQVDGAYGYIDRQGRYVWEPTR